MVDSETFCDTNRKRRKMFHENMRCDKKYDWIRASEVISAFQEASGSLVGATEILNKRGLKICRQVLQTRKNQLVKSGEFPKNLLNTGNRGRSSMSIQELAASLSKVLSKV